MRLSSCSARVTHGIRAIVKTSPATARLLVVQLGPISSRAIDAAPAPGPMAGISSSLQITASAPAAVIARTCHAGTASAAQTAPTPSADVFIAISAAPSPCASGSGVFLKNHAFQGDRSAVDKNGSARAQSPSAASVPALSPLGMALGNG